MTVREALVNARALLLSKGWCKGFSYVDKNGYLTGLGSKDSVAYCVMGAIAECSDFSMGIPDDQMPIFDKSKEALAKAAEIDFRALDKWNDLPSTTLEEVIEAFDKAIEQVS